MSDKGSGRSTGQSAKRVDGTDAASASTNNETTSITDETRAALVATVRRSFEEAFRRESLPVAPHKSQELVERVTEEVSVEIGRFASYRGPMPPPPMMRDFEHVVPGLACEIADAAHEERKHRHTWEKRRQLRVGRGPHRSGLHCPCGSAIPTGNR